MTDIEQCPRCGEPLGATDGVPERNGRYRGSLLCSPCRREERPVWTPQRVQYRGATWEIRNPPTVTSDGMILGTGYLVDADGDDVDDGGGWPVIHSFLLGSVTR